MKEMKETSSSSFFDVWIRVKPYKPYYSSFEKFLEEGPSVTNRQRRTTPGRSRSKSPLTPTPFKKARVLQEREKFTAKKYLKDYQAFKCLDDQLTLKEVVEEIGKEPRMEESCINFPNIIDDKQDNLTLFKRSLEPKIDSCLLGKSFTLLTYGISGSGKSHTIFGSANENIQEEGLLIYFMKSLFEKKQEYEEKSNRTFNVSVSFIEIYNEQARDLLVDNNPKKLTIVENPFTVGVSVPDLTTHALRSYEDLHKDLDIALARRVVCPNLNNQQSSRSHLIVELNIESYDTSNFNNHYLSKVRFVDLAGSEKVLFGHCRCYSRLKISSKKERISTGLFCH